MDFGLIGFCLTTSDYIFKGKTLDIGYVGSTHHVTVGLGLDGYCARYEQDYDGYDGKYYGSRDWSDGDTDLGAESAE